MPILASSTPLRNVITNQRVVIAETGVRPGQIGVDGQPVSQHIKIGPFHAITTRWARGFRRAGIADKSNSEAAASCHSDKVDCQPASGFAAHTHLVAPVRTRV